MQVLCLYGPRKSKPRLKSELHRQQYTATLFDSNHLAHIIVLWQMQKFMCHCTVFALFYFEFESNFQVLGRAVYRRVSCEFVGLTLIEGLIFGILHYLLAAIRYQDTVLKSPLIIRSALILCRSLYLSHVLICSTLYPPGSCSNFEPGPLLKTSKGPAKLIAKCFFFSYSTLANYCRNKPRLSDSR